MPSPRPLYRAGTERSMSFSGRGAAAMSEELKRPRTVPNLRAEGGGLYGGGGRIMQEAKKVMTKVLMNVTIQGSVGPVQVLVTPGNTVAELIMAVVKQYIKEGRRPIVLVKDVDDFDLHYSPFSLECLDREEKLAALGSRNFFMCRRTKTVTDMADGGCHGGGATSSSCSKQAEKAAKLNSPNPWLKFMSFLS